MKRSAVAIATIGTVLGLSVPASAAPAPPNFIRFDTNTSQCTPADGPGPCTLFDVEGVLDNRNGFGSVTVYIEEYEIIGNEVVPIDYEQGYVEGYNIIPLTIDRDLNVSLDPIAVSLQTCFADEDCNFTREVVVSADGSAASSVTTSRFRNTTRDGTCVTTVVGTVRSGGIAGTMTIDGAIHENTGSAQVEDARTTVRCK